MSDHKQLAEWIEWGTKLVGSLWWLVGIVTAGVVVVWKWGRRIFRALVLSDRVHAHWGESPADSLAAIIVAVRKEIAERRTIQFIVARHLRLALYAFDESGRCVWVNDQLAELFGLDSESMHGTGWLRSIVEAERQATWDEWQQARNSGVPYSGEYTIENPRTHQIMKCHTITFPVEIEGKLSCYIGLVTKHE